MRERTVGTLGAVFAVAATLAISVAEHPRAAAGLQDAPEVSEQLAALQDEGMVVYTRECASCHGADGQGDGAGPALSGDMALANKEQVIRQILHGGDKGTMDPFAAVLTDRQVAAVATFVRTSWDNAYSAVLETDVKPLREKPARK